MNVPPTSLFYPPIIIYYLGYVVKLLWTEHYFSDIDSISNVADLFKHQEQSEFGVGFVPQTH